MASNEPFMEAIGDQFAFDEEDLKDEGIEDPHAEDVLRQLEHAELQEQASSQEQDNYSEDQKKLDTVREGTETNQAVTEEKKLRSSSSTGLAGLRDINELDGTDKESDSDGYD